MKEKTPVPCAIDPTKPCSCASLEFATKMFTEVVQILQKKENMTEEEAIAEYKKGDPYVRALATPSPVTNNCLHSPVAKIGMRH